MLRAIACLLSVWSFPLLCAAEAQNGEDACAHVSKVEIPQDVRPSLEEARIFGGRCDALSIFYSHDPDRFRKARVCALATEGLFRSGADPSQVRAVQAKLSGGATAPDIGETGGLTLAMIFQNGDGLARPDVPLARSLVCTYLADAAGAQQPDEGMKDFLARFTPGRKFRLCRSDQPELGRALDFACAHVVSEQIGEEIGKEEERIVQMRGVQLAPELRALQSAHKEFEADEQLLVETSCTGGNGCGVITAQLEVEGKKAWLTCLRLISSGELPPSLPNATSYPSLDGDLNRAYQAALDNDRQMGDLGPELRAETRKAQRAWLGYREAWVRLAAKRWPSVPADCWRGWLTVAQAEALRGA